MSVEQTNVRSFPAPSPDGARKGHKSLAARILRAGYIAEIIRDGLTNPPLFHWVVQQCETGEVLALGQSHTLPDAEISAQSFLDDLRLSRAI
jgi:hypothetical protein